MRKHAPGLRRSVICFLRGCLDRTLTALGLRNPLLPPRDRVFVGSGDFIAVGREFLGYLVQLARLRPDENILDVGCGIGRLAVPLTRYLSRSGRYCGFDIVPDGIAWCREQITPHFPHFEFLLADVRNPYYHPTGDTPAAEYAFPYAD